MPNAQNDNPGRGPTIKAGFANAERTWEEQADLVALLSHMLAEAGHEFRRKSDRLIAPSGLMLTPQFESLEPQNPDLDNA
jgi:hypothetical protein